MWKHLERKCEVKTKEPKRNTAKQAAKECSAFSEVNTHVRQRSYLRGFPAGRHLAVALCSRWKYHRSSGGNTVASRSWCILLIWGRHREKKKKKAPAELLYRRRRQKNSCEKRGFHRKWETEGMLINAQAVSLHWLMTKQWCPFSSHFNSQRWSLFPAN